MKVLNNAAVDISQGSYSKQPETSSLSSVSPVVGETKTIDKAVHTETGSQGDKAEEKETSSEAIKRAVADINKRSNGTEAVFGIHEKTNRLTIKIVDKKSREVIREVPAEKTLDIIAKVWEMAGLMVDEKR